MGKHSKTLADIFTVPTLGNISWRDVVALLKSLGAEISEGAGSRVRVHLNGVRAVLHRPHPEKEAGKGMVESVREFLANAGITPENQK
jgi:hypothetical protein